MSQTNDEQTARKFSVWKLLFRLVLATIIVGLLVAYGMSFQVSEGYNAVVTRFGNPVRAVHEAGLFWKWPWPIEQAHQIDMRRRLHNTPYTATLTRDRKNIILLSYVVWKVQDPLLFLQSLGVGEATKEKSEAAEGKLDGMVAAKKNFYFGRYDLTALVSTNPDDIKVDEIETAVLGDVAADATKKFGIQVEQVGIKRIAYPEENTEAVLNQMRAEREAVAGKLRAEGIKEAQQIQSDARVAAAETIKKGVEEAGRIRGEAKKQAAQIYAKAKDLDPEFYAYWRKLKALETILGQKSTVIMRTDQGPFDIFASPPKQNGNGPAPVQADAEAPDVGAAATAVPVGDSSSPDEKPLSSDENGETS